MLTLPSTETRRVYCIDCRYHRSPMGVHLCHHPDRVQLTRDYVTGRRIPAPGPARCVDFNRDGKCREFQGE